MFNAFNMSHKQYELDLAMLLSTWSEILDEVEYLSRKQSLNVLYSLAYVYCRGQGAKVGLGRSSEVNEMKVTSLVVDVANLVEDDNSRRTVRVKAKGFQTADDFMYGS